MLLVSACAAEHRGIAAAPSDSVPSESPPAIASVTCGGGPRFNVAVLDQPGAAERADDPAAAALRRHLTGGMETDFLPHEGWIEVSRSPVQAEYVAMGPDGSWALVTTEQRDGQWTVVGWGGCDLRPEVPPGANLANFRVSPGEHVTPDSTELDVLVHEIACNSGEDARRRILEPRIVIGPESMIVVMTVRALPGGQDCQGNPETPFLLELPEPLGERKLLDGTAIPPRDALECPGGDLSLSGAYGLG